MFSYPISYSGNFAFPYLLLRPMTPSAPWKRASLLPSIRKPGLIRGRKSGALLHSLLSKLLLSPFLIVEHLYQWVWTDQLCLAYFFQALEKEKPSLYELGVEDRGKGMYVEITQSLASVEKQDSCQSS